MATYLKVLQGAITINCSEIVEIRLAAIPMVTGAMGVVCRTAGNATKLPIAAFTGDDAVEDAIEFKGDLEAAIQKLNKGGGGTIDAGMPPGSRVSIVRTPKAGRS